MIQRIQQAVLVLCLLALLAGIAGWLMANPAWWQPAFTALAVGLPVGLGCVPALKNYRYTACIIAAVVAAMLYPHAFVNWGGVNLRNKGTITKPPPTPSN